MCVVRERRFPRSAMSARAAREFAVDVLVSWGLQDRKDDVRLCVSELATNALLHGSLPGDEFLVRVIRDREVVRIEVEDKGEGCPEPRRPA